MAASLNALPNELLALVTTYLERPRDLLNISLTCQRLYEFIKLDGFKAFLKGRFQLLGLDSDARSAVHGLTTLYRNWERKAFLARYIAPSVQATSLNSWQKTGWRDPQGQTMGYQPIIDSYEVMAGKWFNRREVLAWSAGTSFIMRTKQTGTKAREEWNHLTGEDHDSDNYRQLVDWYTYRIPDGREGRDDIRALKILRPEQKPDAAEYVLFGTAYADLKLVRLDLDGRRTEVQTYDTKRRAVGSLSISSEQNPLIAATLGDSTLGLYPVDLHAAEDQSALSEVTPTVMSSNVTRLWSCNFIADDKVAVGLGPAFEPIHVYQIAPAGFCKRPMRQFSLSGMKDWGSLQDLSTQKTTVYPILPINEKSSGRGNVFLSGGYDGIIRLHDMRSDQDFENMFWDVTNDSSIYSLATQGLERVVAGTSMHSMLKVFDLRFSGSHAYQILSIPSQNQPRSKPASGDYASNRIVDNAIQRTQVTPISGGWNLFLHPRNQARQRSYRVPRTEDSPVYSLSIPAATSPSLYAGVEGAVMCLDFHSVADKHPDSLFTSLDERQSNSNVVDLGPSYSPHNDVLNLGMYEQGNEQMLGMKLVVQDDVTTSISNAAERRNISRFGGLDERWKDPSADGDRWVRGQEPQGPRSGRLDGRGRRGGRGRGRGRGAGRAV